MNFPNKGGTGLLKSTSGKAEGPYVDVHPKGPLTDEIDASLFVDDDGKVYFVYQNGKIARLNEEMNELAEKPRLLKPANNDQVGFEGAFMTKIDGKYVLDRRRLHRRRLTIAWPPPPTRSTAPTAIATWPFRTAGTTCCSKTWRAAGGPRSSAATTAPRSRNRAAILRIESDGKGHIRPAKANNHYFMHAMNYDLLVFLVYLAVVAAVGILASRKEKESDDYFLAGRNLTWWIIGGSLIAANISTHHFIGMSGRGYEIGLAVASYEWIAAIALILYGKFFLPYYLKSRIVTMPEFLKIRFSDRVRLSYAIISLIGYIVIELAVVLYTGSLAIYSIFGLPMGVGLAILCVVGGGYTIYGGFKSVAYTDIIQVTVLICGGLAVTLLGLHKVGAASPDYGHSILGGFRAILADSPEKFHMVRPWNDPELPWIGVFFGGMWLANIFYWGCNQFITQRTLAAKSVWHGQMGVVFAGFLKLLVPVLVVLPGIIAFRLYNPETGIAKSEFVMEKADMAFPTLVKQLLPERAYRTGHGRTDGLRHVAHRLDAFGKFFDFDVRYLQELRK